MNPSIPAPNVMLLGAVGTGKSYSLRTLVDAGMEVFAIFTEPGFEVLMDVDPSKFHIHYIPPAAPSFQSLHDSAKKINMMSFSDLSGLKSGLDKQSYGQFLEVLNTLSHFKCDICGKEFDSVDTFDNTKAVVLDTLSGLNIMSLDLVCGAKPVKAIGEWGVAMDNEERLITKLCADTRCMFILSAHLEPVVDQMIGSTNLKAMALGNKLAPKLPRFFSDVIHCKRVEDNWVWSTVSANVDLKARNLPYKDNMPQDFVPLIETWRNRSFKKAEA